MKGEIERKYPFSLEIILQSKKPKKEKERLEPLSFIVSFS
jgi:hypothetical protein